VIIRTFIFTVLTIITNPGPQLFIAADDHPGHLPEHLSEHPVLSAAGIFIKQTFVWFVKTIFVMRRKSRSGSGPVQGGRRYSTRCNITVVCKPQY